MIISMLFSHFITFTKLLKRLTTFGCDILAATSNTILLPSFSPSTKVLWEAEKVLTPFSYTNTSITHLLNHLFLLLTQVLLRHSISKMMPFRIPVFRHFLRFHYNQISEKLQLVNGRNRQPHLLIVTIMALVERGKLNQ